MNSKPSILIYTPFVKYGGLEKMAIQYCSIFIDMGYDVDLLIDYDIGSENVLVGEIPSEVGIFYAKPKWLSLFVYGLRKISKRFLFLKPIFILCMLISDIFSKFWMRKELDSSKEYDYVINFFQFLSDNPIKIFPKARKVIWLHGSIKHFFGQNFVSRLFYYLYGRKLDRYDHVIGVSREIVDEVSIYFPGSVSLKADYIYNPLDFSDLRTYASNDEGLTKVEKKLLNRSYIVHVSRLDEGQKDISTLLKAFSIVIDRDIDIELVIIGDGPDRGLLIEEAEGLNISSRVHFLGAKKNPHIWFANSELSVLSSKYEGFGLVILEAMVAGAFIISSNCDVGPREILGDGKYGDLFPVGNYEDLASLLIFRLSSEGCSSEITSLYPERIQEFTINSSISKLKSILFGIKL